MQKFYKIFYLDSDDPIFKRDYNIAVGEDLRDLNHHYQNIYKKEEGK